MWHEFLNKSLYFGSTDQNVNVFLKSNNNILIALWLFCILERSWIKNLKIDFKKQMNIPVYYFSLAEDSWCVLDPLNCAIVSSFNKFRMEYDSVTFIFAYYFGEKIIKAMYIEQQYVCLA